MVKKASWTSTSASALHLPHLLCKLFVTHSRHSIHVLKGIPSSSVAVLASLLCIAHVLFKRIVLGGELWLTMPIDQEQLQDNQVWIRKDVYNRLDPLLYVQKIKWVGLTFLYPMIGSPCIRTGPKSYSNWGATPSSFTCDLSVLHLINLIS